MSKTSAAATDTSAEDIDALRAEVERLRSILGALGGQGGGNSQFGMTQGGLVGQNFAPIPVPMYGTPPGVGNYAPQGVLFSGGSPYPVDTRGQKLQNYMILARDLIPALMKLRRSQLGQSVFGA